MRKIMIYIFAMILIVFSATATLNFTEDFEGYPVSNSTWYLATGGTWLCVLGLTGSCVGNSGTPPANANATQYIISDAGNEFLYMAASGNDNSGGKYSSLYANYSSTATIQTNWSVVFDYKLYGTTYTSISAFPQAQRRTFGGIRWDNYGLYGSSPTGWITAVGSKYNASSQEDFERLRRRHDYSGGFDGQPINSQCDVNDGNWHRITQHIIYSGGVYDYVETYIDGALCENSTTNINPTTTSAGNFKLFNPEAREGVAFGIDNIKIYYDELATPSGVSECADGIDNDGDGYTDYPADPSCTSMSDNSESPFDYTQCNNGIDDDHDGYIDYPADPSCDNATDTTESPADNTTQSESACLEEEYCLLNDEFPYTDDITLHGWSGNTSFFSSDLIYSNQRLNFNNFGFENFNFSKNISNSNKYDDVTASFVLFFDNLFENDTDLYNYYVVYKDSEDREIVRLRFDLSRAAADPHIKVGIYYFNGSAYEHLTDYEPDKEDVLSRALFTLDIDQILKTFDFQLTADTTYEATELTWTNVLASKVNSIWIEQGNFSSTKWEIVMDDVSIYGSFTGLLTNCDDWELPYYLIESFNGYLFRCDWLTSNDEIYNNHALSISDDISYFYAQKDIDLAEADKTRYVAMTFDLTVQNISVIGSTITIRLYDDNEFNFLTAYFRDTGNFLFYNDDGTGRFAGNITLGADIPYMFIVDFDDDNWDIFINGTKVVSNSDFSDSFVDVKNIQTIKITANDANFILDNVKIYASDVNGSPLLPDEDLETVTPDADYMMCGYFWKNPNVCVVDADCETGQCNANNKCSSFDYTYCDDKNMVRGNKCIISAMVSCSLTSTKDLIFGHIVLFLVFIVLLILAAYIVLLSGKT